MTYEQLQDEVLDHQFSDTKYRDLIKRWLNEGQRFVMLQTDLRGQQDTQSYTTSAGTEEYALPADFARLISLRNTTDANYLNDITLRGYDDLSASSGKPTSYVVIASNIVVYPSPDAAYSLELRYYKLPADMAANGDEPELPEAYQHLLVRYALIRCYQRENDYEAANYHEGQLGNGLMKLRGEVQYDTADSPKQVGGSFPEDHSIDSSTWW